MSDQTREDLLATYQGATGEEDIGVALQAMEDNDWDLSRALEAAGRHAEAAVTSGREQRQATGAGGAGAGGSGNEGGWLWRTTTAVLGRGWLWGGAGGGGGSRGAGGGGAGGGRTSDDLYHRETASFVLKFDKKYGEVHPQCCLGTFSQAVALARKEFKFVIAYIHTDLHEDAPTFCTEVLCQQAFADLVDDTFVFWMGSMQDAEGFSAANKLKATAFPFVAAATARGGKLEVVDCHDGGSWSLPEAMEWLTHVLEEKGAVLVADRADAEARETDRRLRQESEQAFEQSLAEDAAREREAEERARQESEAQERILAMEAAEAAAKEAAEREEAEKQKRLQEQAQKARLSMSPEPPVGAPGTAAIAVRLPDGNRIQRRFEGSDPISSVYQFVVSDGSVGHETFTLATHFPKKELLDRDITVKEAGLCPQALLFVEGNDEDSDSEDED